VIILTYILCFSLTLLVIFFAFLKYREYKIGLLEEKIKTLFLQRTALIPSICEVSKPYLNKHEDIFCEILKLRKKEFSESSSHIELYRELETKKLIHHEINFIFKVCNKHNKLIKEGKFIYLRNLIIQRSSAIWENIALYKHVNKQQNKLIHYKNMTILWFLLPVSKKTEI